MLGAGVGKEFYYFDKALKTLDTLAPRITPKILESMFLHEAYTNFLM